MFTSNEEGLAKVKEGDYAFFMESSSIDYYTERVCNLTQVGELLDDKSYGIGMRQRLFKFFFLFPISTFLMNCELSNRHTDYKYFDELSEGVLILLERGRLTELKTRWWKQRRGGGACSVLNIHFIPIFWKKTNLNHEIIKTGRWRRWRCSPTSDGQCDRCILCIGWWHFVFDSLRGRSVLLQCLQRGTKE